MKFFIQIMLISFSLSAIHPAYTQEKKNQDWANLHKYREANAALGVPAPGEKRIVFMGNSITESWGRIHPDFFKGRPYINRGISGQTTPQMLIRFRPDVINLKPAVVVILAGTNDIAGNTGPTTLETIAGNIFSMAELARVYHIKVILCSVLPVYDYPWRPGLKPAEKIVRLNRIIRDYAQKHHIFYLDFFAPMADERHGLKSAYTLDGVHPNKAGYLVMESLLEPAIKKVLKSKTLQTPRK